MGVDEHLSHCLYMLFQNLERSACNGPLVTLLCTICHTDGSPSLPLSVSVVLLLAVRSLC
eukprot:3339946-Rhodomonas_salina.3